VALAVCLAVWVGAGTTGIISGVVKGENGEAISGANVIIPGTTLTTVTDSGGRFVITNVPPGEYEVQVEMVGFATRTIGGIHVSMDERATVDVDLKTEVTQEETVVVTRPRPMIVRDQPSTLNLVTAQQEPLTRSDPSFIRSAAGILTALPGVSVETDGSGQLHVRGGRPDQTGWYIEGIPITDPNTGMFGTNLYTTGIGKFQAYTGGFGAEYGNAISGVLNEVKKTGADSPGISLKLEGGNSAYSDAFGEFGGGSHDGFNYYFATALQRTELDGPIVKQQEYSDSTLKLVWPSKSDTFTLLALQGTLVGRMANYHDIGDMNAPTPHEKDFIKQRYLVTAFTWSHSFSPQSFITVRPYHLRTDIVQNLMGGSHPLAGTQYVDVSSARTGLQLGYTNQWGERHLIKAGGSFVRSDNNNYYFVGFPLQTSNVNTSQMDVYAEDQIKLTDRLTFTGGLRHERINYDRVGNEYVAGAGYSGPAVGDVSESTTSPRLGLTYSTDDRTVWKLSWGKYTKFVPASAVQAVYFDPDFEIAGPGGPTLEQVMPGLGATDPQVNTALELSFERQLSDSMAMRVTPFHSKYRNLGDYYTDPNTWVTRYTNLGEGKSTGMEFVLRKRMSDGWQGWLSYTYQKSRSNRAGLGYVDEMYYTAWDQTHTISLVTDYRRAPFSHSLRMDYGSGRTDAGDPTLQERANPSFVMSYSLTYDLPKDSKVGDSVYLSVFNIFNNHQTLQYRWGTDDEGNPVRTRDSWVPSRFVSFGVSSSF
jgi:outer membrane receptor for ferrienterochelin and colicin